MLNSDPMGLVCPYCGLLFFSVLEKVMYKCPHCQHKWKTAEDEELIACLEER